jgi:hypothetical protein
MASPRAISPITDAAAIDANHPRARALIERYERLRQVYLLLNLPDDSRTGRLMDELRLGKEALEQAELSAEGVGNHERTCGVVEAHLLDEFVHRYHQHQVENEDRQRQVDEDLGRLLNPGGRTDRLRDRIRLLENDNRQQGMVLRLQDEVLRQQSTDIRDLRETLTELRREMERRMRAASAPINPEPPIAERQPQPLLQPQYAPDVNVHPVRQPRLLEIAVPPKFTGEDRKVVFTDWWKQVRQCLDSQPPEVIGGEARKIVWVSNLLERMAASWYWNSWKKRVELGVVANRWDAFEAAIKERFRDLEEDVRALQALE